MLGITPQQWKKELPEFKEKTDLFYAGEMNKKDYKGFSGKFGSYAQRSGDASMLRLRMPGGQVTKEKLKFIADSIDKHGVTMAHLTTCQTIQLHNLKPEALYDIMEGALDAGIVTIGGGGDFPRNVMVSPLSGVEKGEYFDVFPWAKAVGEYLLTLINDRKMPRKLKVGFSNGPANLTHATFRDLGFAARPDKTFDVYSAGGLGANPKMGLKVGEKVSPDQVLYYVRAMWETFITYGNYENRGKARTRYMQDALGQEEYKKAFQEKLQGVYDSGVDLKIEAEERKLEKTGDGVAVKDKRAVAQKQDGLYAVFYHPIGGTPQIGKFRQLYEAIKDAKGAELRLCPDESMYIINLNGTEAKRVLEATDDGARTLFETSVACVGASICQVGVRDSQHLLHMAVEAVRKAGLKEESLPQIHISGCPSSCGTHQIGVIGFHGGVKVIDKVPNPSFTLHLYGQDRQGEERFGTQMGVILEKDIPDFLVEAGKAAEHSGKSFQEWSQANPGALEEIAKKYLVK